MIRSLDHNRFLIGPCYKIEGEHGYKVRRKGRAYENGASTGGTLHGKFLMLLEIVKRKKFLKEIHRKTTKYSDDPMSCLILF